MVVTMKEQPLTLKQERFWQALVALGPELGNASAAYRKAYDVSNMKPASIRAEATRMLSHPVIAQRLLDLKEMQAAQVTYDAVCVLRDWVAIATADANEVVSYRRTCCRHCYGFDHGYQWIDENEWAVAVAFALGNEQPAPEIGGGVGFDALKDPHSDCPRCGGEGHGEMHIADTRKLKGSAKLLYRGVKQTKDGVQVILADQDQARMLIAKHFGMLLEGAKAGQTPGAPPPLQHIDMRSVTPQDAARSYLALMGPK